MLFKNYDSCKKKNPKVKGFSDRSVGEKSETRVWISVERNILVNVDFSK